MSLCIKVEHLTKYYGSRQVIGDLDLTIQEGELVIFQGPSGVGKSTFLRCLTYLEPFEKGSVQVGDIRIDAGLDVRKERDKIRQLRSQLGFVFQFFNLFPHLTVLGNLMLGPVQVQKRPRLTVRKEAMRLLERVGLAEQARQYPSSLSGGQRQRVGIARALAMRPKAVLFDEPTSSLDPHMKEEIIRVVEHFAKDGLTMLIVTHEPAFVERIATRVVSFGPLCVPLSDEKIKSGAAIS